MNSLARVKLSNNYDLVVNNLYEEGAVSGQPKTPITDVEGTTALLLTDGTSWEFLDNEWKQIEISTDKIILDSFYSFLTSVCNSVQNDFVKCQLSAVYEGVMLSKENDTITITGLLTPPKVQVGDYVIIRNYVGSNLSVVTKTTDTSISVDATGTDIRISGDTETIGVLFVSLPPDFLDAAISMLGFDMFLREDKEKRQERLGNYTYTNFEPGQYYGVGEYPTNLQNKIKFWQRIHV